MADSNDSSRSGQGEKPVVRAGRRRTSGSQPSGQRQRAEAPQRRGRSDQNQRSTTGGGTTSRPAASQQRPSARPSLPFVPRTGAATGGALTSRRPLVLLVLLALFGCVIVYFFMQSGGGDGEQGYLPAEQAPAVMPVLPTETPAPAQTAKPFVAPAGATSGDTWLVMLYQDADDKILEKDIFVDLNEAEKVGSTENVHIVAQLDRYRGGYTGDGDWTSTKRYYVTQDNDLNRVGSQLVQDMGEQNMADGGTLVDFVTWAVETIPADKYALILSDHGMGWPGGWSDPDPATGGESDTPLSQRIGNQLYLNELDASLQAIRERTGIEKLDLVGLDACLMAQLEVFSALAPHARYAVASEETEPALGWAYASFLGQLASQPSMSGGQLGQAIISSYIREDQRIVDDAARAELMQRGSPMGGLFGSSLPSSDQVASQMGRDVTLSAVDLAAVPSLLENVNGLCLALQGADQRNVARARSSARAYTSVFGQQVPPAYIDLGHFCQLLQQNNLGANVEQAADKVLRAIDSAVVAETHGQAKSGSTGVAIYFPNSQLFGNALSGPPSYTTIANRFAGAALWDDYLAFHYTGRQFDLNSTQAVVPDAGAISAPGKGEFSLSAVELSNNVAAPGRPILLSTDITARNLGHVMIFAGYFDSASNSIQVSDLDYMESNDTRVVEGVYYPVWPDSQFRLEFEWEPIVFYIDDGTDSVAALLTPSSYGATAEEAIYTVDGVYTFDTGEQRQARLYFQDGLLQRVYGFSGDPSASAPREIYPQTGDQFTVLERWFDLDNQGRVVKRVMQEGGTLTFGDQMFTWVELDAAAGDYVVGFIAEDLDGNRQETYGKVRVE